MREFPNPVIYGRGGEKITMPAVWNRKTDGQQFPVTPRRLLLLACYGRGDGRPADMSFSRPNNKVLDQIEPQEKRGTDSLLIDTEQLEFIRPWINKQVAMVWPVDAPSLIDALDDILDKKELKATEAETSDNGTEDTNEIGAPIGEAEKAESAS